MTTSSESARFALATAAALAIGFLAQSALLAVVLALTYPNALRFFGVGAILIYYVPTVVMLVMGAPLFYLRTIRARLRWTGGAGMAALLGALGASVPEMYLCANPLHRCFLATMRDTIAVVVVILSGAACGAAVYFIYRRLAPRKKMNATEPETV